MDSKSIFIIRTRLDNHIVVISRIQYDCSLNRVIQVPFPNRSFSQWCHLLQLPESFSLLFSLTLNKGYCYLNLTGITKETIADVSSASPSSERMANWRRANFTAFHYPHQHTVDTPVCLPPCRRSQPSSLKSWHYTGITKPHLGMHSNPMNLA